MPELVTLPKIATHGSYQGQLLLRFNVLCDTFGSAGMAKLDQSKQDATRTFAMLNIGCQGAVELNDIKHQVPQIGYRRITSTKIILRDDAASVSQLLQLTLGLFHIGKECGFGYLELHTARGETVLL